MEDLPFNAILTLSSIAVILAIIEIIILNRILGKQENQNKSVTGIIQSNTKALNDLQVVLTKVSDSLIRTEERIDKYQSSTNSKLDILKELNKK